MGDTAMVDWDLPWAGGCRCGAVRIAVDAPPLLTAACHCRGCQRMTASAFSLSVAVPADGFAVSHGETVIGGLHAPELEHHFCDRCKSWLFTRGAAMPGIVNVRPTMLDDAGWYVPFIEMWTSTRLPWAATPARHAFAEFPGPDDFPRLVAEFQSRGLADR